MDENGNPIGISVYFGISFSYSIVKEQSIIERVKMTFKTEIGVAYCFVTMFRTHSCCSFT